MPSNKTAPAHSKKRAAKDFRLPHLTCNNICESLEDNGFEVGQRPADATHEFRWYDMIGIAMAFNMPAESDQTIHVRPAKEAAELLEEQPDSYVLTITPDKKLPAELKEHADRVIQVICRSEEERRQFYLVLHEIFLSMLRWENQLNFIMETRGSLESLLNIGATMFDGFIFVEGVDCHIVGYSTEADYPNEEYRRMFEEEKRFSPESFASFAATQSSRKADGMPGEGSLSPANSPAVATAEDEWGNECVVVPMYYHSSYFGYLVLVPGPRVSASPGIKDQFAHFAGYVLDLCEYMWQSGVEKDLPHYYFLTSLLRGESFTNATIESNLNMLGIPQPACFKVVVLDPSDSRQGADVLADAMRGLNKKQSFVVLFNNHLTAILYSEPIDGILSHRRTLEDLDTYLYGPYGIVCGFSQVFGSITDVRLGYRQAVYALENRDAINVETSLLTGNPPLQGISFEMAQPYFRIKENEVDREFHEFSLSYSPLEKLLAADLENDTHDFALLWYFLSYERNASLVGRRMFIHRNSVLYHVRQIEKRYDLDLDDWYVREKILMDYRFLFMRLTDETIKKLFF